MAPIKKKNMTKSNMLCMICCYCYYSVFIHHVSRPHFHAGITILLNSVRHYGPFEHLWFSLHVFTI